MFHYLFRILQKNNEMKTIRTILFSIFIFYGCDMFESHPYDAYVRGEKNINFTQIEEIEDKLEYSKTFRFAFISDTQRWYDETKDFVRHINQSSDIDFVIHGGDISDFGATHEFIMQRDILSELRMPYVALLGNHDCLGTGEDVYKEIWGSPNFCFQSGNVLFVCLNTNALEYDYSEPVPNFEFLEQISTNLPESVKRTIFVMHAPPFDKVFNNNVVKVFQLYLNSFPNLMFCINGHCHRLEINELFDDGIVYYQVPNIEKRTYFVFTITEDGYDYEINYF